MQSTRTCTIDGCDRSAKTRGWCPTHYAAWRRTGDPHTATGPRLNLSYEERFWQKVNKATTSGCWEWQAGKNRHGYGQCTVGYRKKALAHRYAYELRYGQIPKGAVLDHRCANPSCVNPEHLRPTTQEGNGQHLTGPRADSSTGIRGVFPSGKIKKPWRAAISKNGKYVHVGHYETLEEAEAAVKAARRQAYYLDDAEEWEKSRGCAYATPQVVNRLDDTERGANGFGSTGR